jgi:ribosomal protein S18 acetylase RimI-like enzyme
MDGGILLHEAPMSHALPAELALRPATHADVPFLLELRSRTMTAHQVASGLTPSEEERMGRVQYRFECAQIILWNGDPAGLFKVARDGARWKLIQIQLDVSLQGRGVGSGLVSRLIAEAVAAGASLELSVLHANPARRLYERLGFQITGTGPHEYEMSYMS